MTLTGTPKRLPSSISCAVPVGVGEDGVMVAATVTAVPCTAALGVIAIVVVLATAAASTVKTAGAETEAW